MIDYAGSWARPAPDAHHPAVAGVVIQPGVVRPTAPGGAFSIPGSTFALRSCQNITEKDAAALSQHFDAVLYCGLQENPVIKAFIMPQPSSAEPGSENGAELGHKGCSSSVDAVLEKYKSSTIAEPASYMWLPVKSSKFDRQGLQRQLPAGLAYLERHRQVKHRVLVCDDDGSDSCVCVVLAALACEGRTPSEECLTFDQVSARMAGIKAIVRKHLAGISKSYPSARPTRGSLKQVQQVCCKYIS